MTVYAPGGGSSVLGTTDSASPFRTLIGSGAGAAITTAAGATFIGYQAGQVVTTGGSNTFVGYQTGTTVTTGTQNTFIGYQAGQLALATSGNSTLVGSGAGQNNTGMTCTFLGSSVGPNNTGNNNTFIGQSAGFFHTSGVNQVFVGLRAGVSPTNANATTTGSRQTLIGYNTGQNSATQRADVVALGYQALVDGDNAIAIGSGVLAGAAGTVAIGKDSAGTSASSTVANEIKLGTALHTVNIIGKTKIAAQARTGGALPTVQLVSPTGAQIDTTADRETVTAVTFNPSAGASATALVEVSPDNATYTAVGTWTIPAGVTFDGTIELISVAIPAGWYLRITTTNAVLGLTTYY